MDDRVKQLRELLASSDLAGAKALVATALDYHEGEQFVFTVLKAENTTPELIDAVLEAFITTRRNRKEAHGYWVHSLSHFTEELWTRRMLAWIKRLNELAFKGALELGDTNCSDRLVADLGRHGLWSDAPSDVGLTEANLAWFRADKYLRYAKARIDAGRFESKAAYIAWQLRQPDTWEQREWCSSGYDHWSIPVPELQELIGKLAALGGDTAEFKAMIEAGLREQLVRHEAALIRFTDTWTRERIEKDIASTRTVLADFAPTT